ncbi:MAG TPA: GNAT family N-acetyltransferase [Tahibacter sp.]|uniref:GNAT family N-acetyltransferase n=1 Tax=Tahibacter sp. TaxID=2056211 RepID=UPI002C1FB840|nr:GNAT family N-acetyltransferase [Tahibacter sp.]HSX59026.1 GNAT family N-acetyltransferase [Tahibacter sp.]
MSRLPFAQRLPLQCPGLEFVPEQDADTAFVCELYASTRWQEMAQTAWDDDAKRAFLYKQFELQRDHYRKNYVGAEFLVVRQHGQPIGRIYLFASAREIRLMDVALVDVKRGQGLGRAMIEGLMKLAREDAADITLHVEPNNPALQLYRRLGFSLIEDRGVYHFLGWKPGTVPA